MGRHRLVEPQGRVPVPRPAKQRNNLSASPLVSGTVRLFYMSNFQKTVRIMENPTFPTNWLVAAKHLMVSLGGMARAAISLRWSERFFEIR